VDAALFFQPCASRAPGTSFSSLIIRKLGALPQIICAAPVYLGQRGTPHTLADLSGHDCLVYSQDSISSEWPLLDGDKPTQVEVPVRMRSNTLDGVVAAAVEGAGLVYAPALVGHELRQGRAVEGRPVRARIATAPDQRCLHPQSVRALVD
jgi:DNA-binding transcriptional LysR family regulator